MNDRLLDPRASGVVVGTRAAREGSVYRLQWCYGAHDTIAFHCETDVLDFGNLRMDSVSLHESEAGLRVEIARNHQSIWIAGFQWMRPRKATYHWPAYTRTLRSAKTYGHPSPSSFSRAPVAHRAPPPTATPGALREHALKTSDRPTQQTAPKGTPRVRHPPATFDASTRNQNERLSSQQLREAAVRHHFKWCANQHLVLDFNPAQDTIDFGPLPWGQFTIDDHQDGVKFRFPINNQCVTLRNVWLAELSEQSFRFSDETTRSQAYSALNALGLGLLR